MSRPTKIDHTNTLAKKISDAKNDISNLRFLINNNKLLPPAQERAEITIKNLLAQIEFYESKRVKRRAA
jgi:hypothetical protein